MKIQSDFCVLNSAHTHLVPVDVCEKQHSALWRARSGRRWRCDRRLGNLWQSDVPGRVNVKHATRRAHQHCTCFAGPQQRALQGPDEVISEELGYVPTHLHISHMQTDACLADRMRHPLFVHMALIDATMARMTQLLDKDIYR